MMGGWMEEWMEMIGFHIFSFHPRCNNKMFKPNSGISGRFLWSSKLLSPHKPGQKLEKCDSSQGATSQMENREVPADVSQSADLTWPSFSALGASFQSL